MQEFAGIKGAVPSAKIRVPILIEITFLPLLNLSCSVLFVSPSYHQTKPNKYAARTFYHVSEKSLEE
jgi:hypothetical protein